MRVDSRRRLAVMVSLGALLGTAACSAESPSSDHSTENTQENDQSGSAEGADGGSADGSSGSPDAPNTGVTQSPEGSDPGVGTEPPKDEPRPKGGDQRAALKNLPGSEDSGCVAVKGESTVRSGAVAAGDFAAARAALQNDGPVPIFFIPENVKGVKSATIKLTSPSGSTKRVTARSWGEANEWKYISAMLPLDDSGPWTIRASLGDQRGCFTVDWR